MLSLKAKCLTIKYFNTHLVGLKDDRESSIIDNGTDDCDLELIETPITPNQVFIGKLSLRINKNLIKNIRQ